MGDIEYQVKIINWQELSAEQYETLAGISRAAYSEYVKDNINFRGINVTGAELKERMERGRQTAFLLVVDGRVAAFCLAFLSGEGPGKHMHNEGVAVHPDFRRQGLGKRIVLEHEQWAREQGARYIELSTSLKATNAIRFHKSNGYVPYGYTYYPGKTYQSIVMRKYFGAPWPAISRWRHLLKTWLMVNLVRNWNGKERFWIRLKRRLLNK